MKSVYIAILRPHYRLSHISWDEKGLHNTNQFSTWNEVLELCKQLAPLYRVEIDVYEETRLPTEFPDCIVFEMTMRWRLLETPWIDGLSKIPSLEQLHVWRIKFDRVPSSLRLKRLTLACPKPPYWMLETTDLTIASDGDGNWEYNLRNLRDLLEYCLLCPDTRFHRWLTKGLYDPRLLFKLRDFLL
jgi:hypothetical protein